MLAALLRSPEPPIQHAPHFLLLGCYLHCPIVSGGWWRAVFKISWALSLAVHRTASGLTLVPTPAAMQAQFFALLRVHQHLQSACDGSGGCCRLKCFVQVHHTRCFYTPLLEGKQSDRTSRDTTDANAKIKLVATKVAGSVKWWPSGAFRTHLVFLRGFVHSIETSCA